MSLETPRLIRSSLWRKTWCQWETHVASCFDRKLITISNAVGPAPLNPTVRPPPFGFSSGSVGGPPFLELSSHTQYSQQQSKPVLCRPKKW